MRHLRGVLFQAGLVAITAVLGLVGLPLLLVAPRGLMAGFGRFWACCAIAWARIATGISWELRGRENIPTTAPAIVALKHQSAFEALALHVMLRDPAIICKRELLRIPVFGWYLKAAGVIAIDRGAGAAALRAMVKGARAEIARGRSVAIFPEGTRGRLGGKLPYQPGTGALYAQLGVPLVPVALNAGLYWRPGLFDKRPGRIVIEFLPAIPPGLERRAAMALLETRIEEATARLLAEGSGGAATNAPTSPSRSRGSLPLRPRGRRGSG